MRLPDHPLTEPMCYLLDPSKTRSVHCDPTKKSAPALSLLAGATAARPAALPPAAAAPFLLDGKLSGSALPDLCARWLRCCADRPVLRSREEVTNIALGWPLPSSTTFGASVRSWPLTLLPEWSPPARLVPTSTPCACDADPSTLASLMCGVSLSARQLLIDAALEPPSEPPLEPPWTVSTCAVRGGEVGVELSTLGI